MCASRVAIAHALEVLLPPSRVWYLKLLNEKRRFLLAFVSSSAAALGVFEDDALVLHKITYRQIKLYLIQEERGLPFPNDLNSILEEEDCEIVDVVVPENSIPQEGSDGKIDESNSTGLFSKPSWLADDTENVKRVPRRRGGRERSPSGQGPLKTVKSKALNPKESDENENGIAPEETLLQWITTADGASLAAISARFPGTDEAEIMRMLESLEENFLIQQERV